MMRSVLVLPAPPAGLVILHAPRFRVVDMQHVLGGFYALAYGVIAPAGTMHVWCAETGPEAQGTAPLWLPDVSRMAPGTALVTVTHHDGRQRDMSDIELARIQLLERPGFAPALRILQGEGCVCVDGG